MLYWRESSATLHPRFGFIVSKAVGNAVTRNLVRRRLKSIAHLRLKDGPALATGGGEPFDVVIRVLPGAAQAGWATLEGQVTLLLRGLDPDSAIDQHERAPEIRIPRTHDHILASDTPVSDIERQTAIE